MYGPIYVHGYSMVYMHGFYLCTGTQTGRHCTVSIALPGSIIDNAQTHELKTYLAGQVKEWYCCDDWAFALVEYWHEWLSHLLSNFSLSQIARTAAVFCIDEIIVFDEQGYRSSFHAQNYMFFLHVSLHFVTFRKPSATATAQGQKSDPNIFLARLLQYQETPQYVSCGGIVHSSGLKILWGCTHVGTWGRPSSLCIVT